MNDFAAVSLQKKLIFRHFGHENEEQGPTICIQSDRSMPVANLQSYAKKITLISPAATDQLPNSYFFTFDIENEGQGHGSFNWRSTV